MVSYSPPSHFLNVFNPADYGNTLNTDYYSKSEANAKFVDITSLQTVTGQKIFTSEIDSTTIVNSDSITTKTLSTTGFSTTSNSNGLGDFIRLLLTDGSTYLRFSRLGTGTSSSTYITHNYYRINGSSYSKDTSTKGASLIGFSDDGTISFQNSSTTETSTSVKAYIDSTGDLYCNYDIKATGDISSKTVETTGYQSLENNGGLGDFMRFLLTDGVTKFRFTRLGTGSVGSLYMTNNYQRTSYSTSSKDSSSKGSHAIIFGEDGSLTFQNGSSSDASPSTKMILDTDGDLNCNNNVRVTGDVYASNFRITGDMFLGNSSIKYISGSVANFESSAGLDISIPIQSGSTGAMLLIFFRDMNGVYGYFGTGACITGGIPWLSLSSYGVVASNPFLAGGLYGQSQVLRIATNSNTSLYYSIVVISL